MGGARAGVGDALGQGIELVAAVEAPGEAGEVALGVLGANVMVGAGERRLRQPRRYRLESVCSLRLKGGVPLDARSRTVRSVKKRRIRLGAKRLSDLARLVPPALSSTGSTWLGSGLARSTRQAMRTSSTHASAVGK